MKKFGALTLTAALVISIMSGCGKKEEVMQKPEEPDVRQVLWNMTMDEVIFCEGKQPDEILDNALIYKNVRMEKIPEADIAYNFYNIDLINTDGTPKLLSSVVYTFTGAQKLTELQLHNSYVDVVAEYNKKYGDYLSDSRVTEHNDFAKAYANGSMDYKKDAGSEDYYKDHEIFDLSGTLYDTFFALGGTALYTTEWMNDAETSYITLKMTYNQGTAVMEVTYEYYEPNNDI